MVSCPCSALHKYLTWLGITEMLAQDRITCMRWCGAVALPLNQMLLQSTSRLRRSDRRASHHQATFKRLALPAAVLVVLCSFWPPHLLPLLLLLLRLPVILDPSPRIGKCGFHPAGMTYHLRHAPRLKLHDFVAKTLQYTNSAVARNKTGGTRIRWTSPTCSKLTSVAAHDA